MSLFDPGDNVQVLQAPNEWAGDIGLLCSWVFTLLAVLLVCGSVSPNAPLPPPTSLAHPPLSPAVQGRYSFVLTQKPPSMGLA